MALAAFVTLDDFPPEESYSPLPEDTTPLPVLNPNKKTGRPRGRAPIFTPEEKREIKNAENKEWREKNPYYNTDMYYMRRYGAHICPKCNGRFPMFYVRTASKRRYLIEEAKRKTKSVALNHFNSHVAACSGTFSRIKQVRQNERVKMKVANGIAAPKYPNKAGQRNKDYVNEYKLTHPCLLCGEAAIECLDFHHRDEASKIKHKNGKTKSISKLCQGGSLERLIEEIAKCEVLCANCHRKITYGTLYLILDEDFNLRW